MSDIPTVKIAEGADKIEFEDSASECEVWAEAGNEIMILCHGWRESASFSFDAPAAIALADFIYKHCAIPQPKQTIPHT